MLAFTDLGRHYTQAELARAKKQKLPTIYVWGGAPSSGQLKY
jgi:hypothetical protein